MERFLLGDYASAPVSIPETLLSLTLAFVAGHIIAWVYMWTHSGLSYSRTFVASLLLIPIIVALVMMVLSNNLVTAFGLMAVFAIVRFRNILRDTLDTTYILAVIVIGMGCGTQKFSTAALGCLVTAFVALYIWFTALGSRHRYDMVLNLQWNRPADSLWDLQRVLWRHCRKIHITSERTQEGIEAIDLSYRLLLRNPEQGHALMDELRTVDGVARLTGMRTQDEDEV